MGGEPTCAELLVLHDKYHYLYKESYELNPCDH